MKVVLAVRLPMGYHHLIVDDVLIGQLWGVVRVMDKMIDDRVLVTINQSDISLWVNEVVDQASRRY